MFTFIKKVIKTGTATSSYPLEPIAVDKNFRGKPEHNPQQCIAAPPALMPARRTR